MARSAVVAGATLAVVALVFSTSAFVQPGGPAARSEAAAPSALAAAGSLRGFVAAAPEGTAPEAAPRSTWSWAAPLLSLGAALGLLASVVIQPAPARAITFDQFNQLTYSQVKGSGLANRCPTVENQGVSVPVKPNSRLRYVCFEPKSFAVEAELEPGKKEFVSTKLTTRQTYTLDFIEGTLNPSPMTFTEQDGMDFQVVTVKLPNGEYVPFMFTVKDLVAKGEGSEFKPGFQWGGEYMVPSYRGGGFLDPKGRGMYTGYDQAVGLAAGIADGKEGQEELFKETNKVFDIGKGAIEMEVNKVNQENGEIGGVFVAKQPSDTDMGAKEPKTILLKGIFYGRVV